MAVAINFLGVFEKKISKNPLKCSVHTKTIQNPSLEKFLDTPCTALVTPLLYWNQR
jgi:hypothetical protein